MYKYGFELELMGFSPKYESYNEDDQTVFEVKFKETQADTIYKIVFDNSNPSTLEGIKSRKAILEFVTIPLEREFKEHDFEPIEQFLKYLKSKFNEKNTPLEFRENQVINTETYSFIYKPVFTTKIEPHASGRFERVDLQVTYDIPLYSFNNFFLRYNPTQRWDLQKNALFSTDCFEKFKQIQKWFQINLFREQETFNFFEFLRYYIMAASYSCPTSGHLGNKAYFSLMSRVSFKDIAKSLIGNNTVSKMPMGLSINDFFMLYLEKTCPSLRPDSLLFPELYGGSYLGNPAWYYFYDPIETVQKDAAISEKSLSQYSKNTSDLFKMTQKALKIKNFVDSIFSHDTYSSSLQKEIYTIKSLLEFNIQNYQNKNKSWSPYHESSPRLISVNLSAWDWFSPVPLQDPNDPMGLYSRSFINNPILPIVEVRNFSQHFGAVENFGQDFKKTCLVEFSYGFKGTWPN